MVTKIPFSKSFNLISDEKKTSPKEINIQTATDGGQDKAVPQDVFNYLSTLEANLTTRYACSYCGDRFSKRHYRDTHEKDNHVDKDGKFTELTCDLCQEKLPTPEQYRRYGNTGCGVFKRGLQNSKDFCLKINIPRGNY